MHIASGLIPSSTCIAGYAIAGGATWYSLRQIGRQYNPQQDIPKASLLTAAFFVISSIHIPVPPTSIHLVLNGLVGIVLGYYAFPALLIGLFFQAVMFGHGGLDTLGVNAVIMGVPALFAFYLFEIGKSLGRKSPLGTRTFAFLSGAIALGLSALLFTSIAIASVSDNLNVQAERAIALVALGGYGIQALVEGTFTAMLVAFLEQVKPELLDSRWKNRLREGQQSVNRQSTPSR